MSRRKQARPSRLLDEDDDEEAGEIATNNKTGRKVLLSLAARESHFPVITLSFLDAKGKEERRELWHGFCYRKL